MLGSRACVAALLVSTASLLPRPAEALAQPLPIRPRDSIVVLGNTFAERMHLFGYFETFLHCRFPQHRLRIRNLGWSADELGMMIRPLGFADLFAELEDHRANVILLCFGMNESFHGPARVADFARELGAFVESLQARKFNGNSPPRIVLVTPIAHENLGGDLPDGFDRNAALRPYVAAMAQVARERESHYVDLFTPTARWMSEQPNKKLTFNGMHLTEYGDWVVSRMLAAELGLAAEDSSDDATRNPLAEEFRRAVYEKNYHFFQWWHPPNASYIHGRRNQTPGAKHLAAERAAQARLVETLDEAVWDMAKPPPHEVWGSAPIEGRPIWFPTPPDRKLAGAPPAQWAVSEDGDPDGRISSPPEQLARFQLPPGYQVNLYASELDFPIANPMAIQFDARGRLWIANTPTWPHALPGRRPLDSLVVLEDVDHDGVADQHRVFLDHMNLIHGFALSGDDVYVAQTPNLVWARDTDGDDRADWVRIALHGFGAEDAEHSMNNFRWSPDGSLFFTQGIFFHTQVETPYGPVRARDAAVFRYRPPEARLDVYASHHFWNPYGTVFDRWGRGIVLDASAGQYYPLDVLAANFHYPKQKERTDHLSFAPGGSIAAGCDFLHSRHFPDDVQGRFLVNHCEGDVGAHWYTLTASGTNYTAERHQPSLLTCDDKTFRPVAMALGPDGAVYVADFYSHIFENVNFSKRHPGRDHSHGRIWRISHVDRPPLTAPAITGRPIPELLDRLRDYEDSTREFARRELQRRGRDAVLPVLRSWVAGLAADDPEHEHHLTEALWVAASLNHVDAELLERLLTAQTPGARLAATQLLRYWQDSLDDPLRILRRQIRDPDPGVRLHAILACGFSTSDAALEIVLEAANQELDPGLEHALNETISYLENRATISERPPFQSPPASTN